MAVITTVDFKKEVEKFFRHFDRLEFEDIEAMFAEDGQGVDEISKGWIRGRSSMTDYFAQLVEMGVSDIHSALSDFETKQWDDVALTTLMFDQTYRVGGDMVSITAPTSMLFRRIDDAWKLQLVHAVALPDEE